MSSPMEREAFAYFLPEEIILNIATFNAEADPLDTPGHEIAQIRAAATLTNWRLVNRHWNRALAPLFLSQIRFTVCAQKGYWQRGCPENELCRSVTIQLYGADVDVPNDQHSVIDKALDACFEASSRQTSTDLRVTVSAFAYYRRLRAFVSDEAPIRRLISSFPCVASLVLCGPEGDYSRISSAYFASLLHRIESTVKSVTVNAYIFMADLPLDAKVKAMFSIILAKLFLRHCFIPHSFMRALALGTSKLDGLVLSKIRVMEDLSLASEPLSPSTMNFERSFDLRRLAKDARMLTISDGDWWIGDDSAGWAPLWGSLDSIRHVLRFDFLVSLSLELPLERNEIRTHMITPKQMETLFPELEQLQFVHCPTTRLALDAQMDYINEMAVHFPQSLSTLSSFIVFRDAPPRQIHASDFDEYADPIAANLLSTSYEITATWESEEWETPPVHQWWHGTRGLDDNEKEGTSDDEGEEDNDEVEETSQVDDGEVDVLFSGST